MREVELHLGKRAARFRAEAHAAVFAVDGRNAPAHVAERRTVALVLDHHQAAAAEVDSLHAADVPLEGLGDGFLEAGLGLLEREGQRGLFWVVESGDGGHAALALALVDGGDATLEVGEQPAVPILAGRLAVHLHDNLGDDAQDAFAADAEVAHVDAVATLGHGAGDDGPAGCDHTQADDHVLNFAVNVALHPGGPCRHPAAQGAVQKGVREVAKRDAVFGELILKVLAVHAGLDARGERVLIDLQHPVHAAHVQADDHAAIAVARFEAAGDV